MTVQSLTLSISLPAKLEGAARQLRAVVESSTRIAIAGEASPDPDCAGTQLALRQILRAINPDCGISLINDHGCPRSLSWLPESKKLRAPRPNDNKVDAVIFVDGGIERCGENTIEVFKDHSNKIIIDHHYIGSNSHYDIELTDPEFASTTELAAALSSFWQTPIRRRTAIQLYCGLIADTGSFQFSNTTSRTFKLASELIQLDLDIAELARLTRLTIPADFIKLQQRVLPRVQLLCDGQLLVIAVHDADLKGLKLGDVPADRMLRDLTFVQGVEVAVMLKGGEQPNPKTGEAAGECWRKLSLRSTGSRDVAQLARSLDPNGGGHKKAAGCKVSGLDSEIIGQIETWFRK